MLSHVDVDGDDDKDHGSIPQYKFISRKEEDKEAGIPWTIKGGIQVTDGGCVKHSTCTSWRTYWLICPNDRNTKSTGGHHGGWNQGSDQKVVRTSFLFPLSFSVGLILSHHPASQSLTYGNTLSLTPPFQHRVEMLSLLSSNGKDFREGL